MLILSVICHQQEKAQVCHYEPFPVQENENIGKCVQQARNVNFTDLYPPLRPYTRLIFHLPFSPRHNKRLLNIVPVNTLLN